MAQAPPRPAPPAADADPPVRVRRLRIESEFRETTRGLERRERDRYGSMLWNLLRGEFAPKVRIVDLVGPGADAGMEPQDEDSLRSVVDFYHKRDDRPELIQVLKFLSVYLIQRGRAAPSFALQRFLLFKAVDLLRMLVHYSPWAVNRDAETLVFALFEDMNAGKGGRFPHYVDTERDAYLAMKRLQDVPRDFAVRLRLGEAYARQTSFFDAVVQYDFLRRHYPRFLGGRRLEHRLALVHLRLAAVFQDIVEHVERGDFQDARKLKSFVERYNREFATRKTRLEPPGTLNPRELRRTGASVRAAAEHHYRQALQKGRLRPEQQTEAALQLSRHLGAAGRPREALGVLSENYRYWDGLPADVPALQGRVAYLEELINLAMRARRRGQASWAAGEQRTWRARLDEQARQRTEYERRREAVRREALGEEAGEVL